MPIPSTLRTFVTLVCAGQMVVTPANAQGCELWNWLTGRSTAAATTPPPSVSFAPQVTNYPAQQTMFYQPAMQQPQMQTVNFLPQTTYRTEMRSVPVTVYRPVPVYQGNQPGPPTMAYQGCTTNRFQVQRNPYLTHHAVVPATATCPTACGQPGVAAPTTGNPGYYTAPATGGQEQWVPRDQGQQSMIQGSTQPPAQFSPQGSQFQGQQPQAQQATPWQPVDPGAGQSSTYGQGQSTYGQQPSTSPSGGSQYSGEPADQRPTLNRPEMYDNQNGNGSTQSGQYITPSQQESSSPPEATAPTDWQPQPASEDDYQSSQRSNPQVNATPATITPPVTMPQSRGQQPSTPRNSSGLSPVVPIPDPQFAPQSPTDEAPSLLDPRDKTVSRTTPRATIPVAWNEPQPRPFTQTGPEQTATRPAPRTPTQVQTISQRATEPKPAFDDSGWTSVRGK